MNQQTIDVLGYQDILKEVGSYAITDRAKLTIEGLRPSTNKKSIENALGEVHEALQIMKISSSVPLHTLNDMEQYIEQSKKGLYIRPDQFTRVFSFLDHCNKLKRFMKDKRFAAPTISLYAESIEDLSELEAEITRCLRHGQVDDYASKELLYTRRQLSLQLTKMKDRAQIMVKSKSFTPYLQEGLVSERSGRFVFAVKKEYRNKIKGTIIDSSASGATLFIQPKALEEIQESIEILKVSEEHEVEKILYELTEKFLCHEHTIKIAMGTMHHYDVIFAKAKHSLYIRGECPLLNEDYVIRLKGARHPMLKENSVPLALHFGDSDRALVITGPNTGGKTVTLKTIGLLTMMAQTGLYIPVEKGSTLHIFHRIFVDIGDGQSIEENLSTFSSRLLNIIEILKQTDNQSLVLLDELGSGTDPSEGMALAIVILEQLFEKGATLFATTHYSEMKEFADQKEGFVNGSMEFDIETLRPTYRLLLGESGKSQAFDIALKLGLHPKLIEKAYQITYKKEMQVLDQVNETKLKDLHYVRQITTNKYARINPTKRQHIVDDKVTIFEQGDNVTITATNETGIVYKGPDHIGNYIVQIKGKKKPFNHKRLKLHIKASELYPENYDFDIIFKSVEYRKVKSQLDRKHVEGLNLEEE
ncbi:DNA mismatch repair protein [Paenisporosarcina sp. OV554]|uniref:endonuclease MutS2 n=1 Tax=Paenisporosarcina sp. OV554 TaxID=2135694 RepID=UPI000D3759D0|nr:DNA mismatch repair protein [Paenisporosarcina sp. OV554]PUB08253.1 MutS2 family protein [Paenisporosarcina sp. OV554]